MVMAILLCVHVVRSGRETYWLWIILAFQPLGGVVYLVTNVLPELFGGRQAQQLGQAARRKLDPTRAYREAKAACEDAPTVRNQSKLAEAASDLGQYAEAETLYAKAAQGIHAEDPTLLLGRARALIELSRHAEALEILNRMSEDEADGRTPAVAGWSPVTMS